MKAWGHQVAVFTKRSSTCFSVHPIVFNVKIKLALEIKLDLASIS